MRCVFLCLPVVCFLGSPLSALAESGPQTVSYTKSTSPLDKVQAKIIIQQYYNNHGKWAGTYNMQSIKSIRLQRNSDSRVVAHVEYSYTATTPAVKHHSGTDRRTFVLVRHKHWSVVGMGRHMSGSL